jgi:hypothetical protein
VTRCLLLSNNFLWLYEISLNRRKRRNIYRWPREQYNELLAKIKLLESSEKKSTTDYYNLKGYDIFIIGGYERPIPTFDRGKGDRGIVEIYWEELLRHLI